MALSRELPVVIAGAGTAGLTAAVCLLARGYPVIILEKETVPGGKMRRVTAGPHEFDGGPTVLTMKWVFDDILDRVGCTLEDLVSLEKAALLARHWWHHSGPLDLHADTGTTAAAIERFCGARDADGYVRFCEDSAKVFATLKNSFMDAQRPGPIELSRRIGLASPGKILALRPFSNMWQVLGEYFQDQRLRQLFGRYATYVGSSPFRSPATLMLIAHAEQEGVWLVDGGMRALAGALAAKVTSLGADIRYGIGVDQIFLSGDGVRSVRTEAGEEIECSGLIFNGDVSALRDLLGSPNKPKAVQRKTRSLSAMIWCAGVKRVPLNLAHHSVFFSNAYEREFSKIFNEREVPHDPTIYICAQDRTDSGNFREAGEWERLFLLVNAPPDGDRREFGGAIAEAVFERVQRRLALNGFSLEAETDRLETVTPTEFADLFPATGGALYGRASHGWMASFQRMGARPGIPGIYLAGGSVHPGPGVPMAALSGKLAADCLARDHAST